MSTAEATNQNSNYAFEIRFVDDNIVQVFDIAAKRKQDDKTLLLPAEYKQEDVLKGQLRYSKLVGSDGSSNAHVEKDTFGLEDTGLPYQHIVTTKRSKNRKSTQRHTFFMMGGGDNEPYTTSTTGTDDIDDGYDSGTAVTEINDEYTDYNRNENNCIQEESQYHDKHQDEADVNLAPKSPQSIEEPTIQSTSFSAWQPVIQQQQQQQAEQQQQQQQEPTLPPAVKQRISVDQMPFNTNTLQQPIHNPSLSPSLEMYKPTQSNVTFPTTQDYTSITAVNTNHSKNYISQQQPKEPKRGCCIIS